MNTTQNVMVKAFGLSVAYCALAYGTIMLGREVGVAAVVWPANALALGVLILCRRPVCAFGISGVAIANALAHILAGDAVMNSIAAGAANGLSIAVTASLFALWRVTRDEPTHVGRALTLIAISLVGPIPGSVLGGFAIGDLLSPETSPIYYIGSWWLVEAVAYLLLLPPFLFWRSPAVRRAAAAAAQPGLRPSMRRLELFGAISILAVSAAMAPLTGMIWLIELSGAVMLWFALRFGMFHTAMAAAFFGAGVVLCGLVGVWPSASPAGTQADMLALQAMIALTTLPALVVAAIVSQREKARQALAASERRLSHALEGANDGLWDWDFVAGAGFFSQRAATMFGYNSPSVFAASADWDSLIHPDDREDASAAFNAHIRGETEFYEVEIRCRRRDGGWVWVHDRGKIVDRDKDGAPLRAVGTYTDISERKRLEAALEELATMDALTGLFNRAVFTRELERFSARLDRQGGRLAVLLIDVDHFKVVNDTYGHGAGDAVLAHVAQRMQKLVRAGDVAARLGGDEFALISIGQNAAEFDALAERLSVELAEPVIYKGQTVKTSVSIGVAVASSGAQAGDELVVRADRALYAAKRDGRGVWRFFAGAERRPDQASA